MSALRRALWSTLGGAVFRLSPKPAYRFRARWLRLFGARVDADARFRSSVSIQHPWRIAAGPRTMFGDDVAIWGDAPVTVGARTTISQMCKLCATDPIEIADDCWIAADSLVLPGARVGRGTLVGARSTIEGALEPWKVAAGEPARARGARFLRGVSPNAPTPAPQAEEPRDSRATNT